MRKILLIKQLIVDLNRIFPSGSVPSRIYIDRELKNVLVKRSDKFIATCNKDATGCVIYCFDYPLFNNKLFKKKVGDLLEHLDSPLEVKFQHIVCQRRIRAEALLQSKISIGKVW